MKNRWAHQRLLTFCLAISVGLGAGGIASAQSDEDSGSSGRLEEIIVTAQKREATIQEVPMSVTALGEATLQVIGAQGFEDYARFVPGLSFVSRGEHNRSFQPSIRGVQLTRASPTTAYYIDETPLQPLNFDRIGLPDPNMFDVQRVEVLKGPQGTLYGASSMGGAIKVITNAPNNQEYEARLQADLSQVTDGGAGWEVSGMTNVPIIENVLAFRASATLAHADGYIRGVEGSTFIDLGIANGTPVIDPSPTPAIEAIESASLGGYLNESDFFAVRAALEWQVNDKFSITPNLFIWNNDTGHGRKISPAAFNASNDELLIYPVFDGVRAPLEQQSELYNIKANYDADWGEVVASLTFYNTDWLQVLPDAGFLFRSGVPTDILLEDASEAIDTQDGSEEQVAFELRASTNLDGSVNVTGGVFYRDLDRTFVQFAPAPASMVPFLGTNLFDNERRRKSLEEIAVFGEVSWELTDSVEVTGGLRWTDYERGGLTTLTGFFAAPPIEGKVSEDLVNYSASISWSPNDESTFYARTAEGFRTGFVGASELPGACDQDLLDLGITPGPGGAAVNADEVTNFEAGWKGRLFNDRLSINASAYQIDWEDVQIDIRLDCGFSLQQNAGQAEVKGFELEIVANPIDSVRLSLAVGQADSQLTEDAPDVGGVIGEPLPEVSEWTASGAIEYFPPAFAAANAYIRLDGTYTDGSLYNFRTDNARERDIKEELFLANVRFGFTVNEWDVSVYAKNVANKLERGQCRDTSFDIIGERTTCANVPRTIGIRVGKDFSF